MQQQQQQHLHVISSLWVSALLKLVGWLWKSHNRSATATSITACTSVSVFECLSGFRVALCFRCGLTRHLIYSNLSIISCCSMTCVHDIFGHGPPCYALQALQLHTMLHQHSVKLLTGLEVSFISESNSIAFT
jgi:hypothetical protein